MEDRTKYIGGSDVGAILGVNPWRTPLDVFYEKTGLKESENVDNEYMYWGAKIEPLIIGKFCEQTKLIVKAAEIKYHEKYPFLAAHVDGLVYDQEGNLEAILECKCASDFKKSEWGADETDQIPESYKLQVAHYANIYDIDNVYIAVLFGGNKFKIYMYERNYAGEKEVEDKLVDFWNNNVLKMEAPMPISIDEAKKEYADTKEGSVITADNDILDNYYDYLELNRQLKAIEKEMAAKKLKILNFMKDAETLVDNSGEKLCTWKTRISKRFDTTSFKSDHEDLYADYLNESNSRTFLIKEGK